MAAKKKTPALPIVRKIKFPLDPEKLRNWTGSRALSSLFHGLSVMFPEGEKEFIESVRPFVQKLADAELKANADAFTKQEAHHTREHAHYNELLEKLGYPAKELDRDMKRKIGWAKEKLSLRTRLAFTVASEHFTAVLADAILSGKFPFEKADPVLVSMWRWHAIEEIEHKAVAFDVYEATEATYAHRVFTMAVVTLLFGYDIATYGSAMMRADGIEPREGWREIGKLFFSETDLGWRVLKNYIAYYKPGFHPWDHQNGHHIARWNQDYNDLQSQLAATV